MILISARYLWPALATKLMLSVHLDSLSLNRPRRLSEEPGPILCKSWWLWKVPRTLISLSTIWTISPGGPLGNTSVDGEAWLELLGHCNSWKIRQIQMKSDKKLWERLARAASQGSIGTLKTTTKAVAAGVRIAHIEAVKLITEEFSVFDHVDNTVVTI